MLLFLLGHVAGSAEAGHTEEERGTSESPYTLRPGEVKIGYTTIDVGLGGHPLLERIEVGTNPSLWLLNAAGIRTYNGHLKYEHYGDEHLSFSVAAGLYHFDVSALSLDLIPLEAYGAYRTKRWSFALGAVYTRTLLRGETELSDSIDGLAELGVETMIGKASATWVWTNVTALVLSARVLGFQRVEAAIGASIEPGPIVTEVEGGLQARADLTPRRLTGSVGAALHWSWERFNLELGLRYGAQTIAGVNLVFPKKLLLPFGDIYWRF